MKPTYFPETTFDESDLMRVVRSFENDKQLLNNRKLIALKYSLI